MAARVLVIGFFRVIFVPLGNFHNDIFCAVGDALAAEARFRRYTRSFIELVELGIGCFVARIKALMNDYVACGTCADTAAGVVEALMKALRDIEDAAG